jgi:hypothetical protein
MTCYVEKADSSEQEIEITITEHDYARVSRFAALDARNQSMWLSFLGLFLLVLAFYRKYELLELWSAIRTYIFLARKSMAQ